jgi:hypothetical protein
MRATRDRVVCELIGVQCDSTTGELTLCVATTNPVREFDIRVPPENVKGLRHALMRLEESLAEEDVREAMVN